LLLTVELSFDTIRRHLSEQRCAIWSHEKFCKKGPLDQPDEFCVLINSVLGDPKQRAVVPMH
jgi:hypothetical protein